LFQFNIRKFVINNIDLRTTKIFVTFVFFHFLCKIFCVTYSIILTLSNFYFYCFNNLSRIFKYLFYYFNLCKIIVFSYFLSNLSRIVLICSCCFDNIFSTLNNVIEFKYSISQCRIFFFAISFYIFFSSFINFLNSIKNLICSLYSNSRFSI